MISRQELEACLKENPFSALWEIVYRDLYNDIMYARLMPGDKINEAQLANTLGISRSPVKQAIERLCEEGLLLREGNKIAKVQVMTLEDCVALYDARKSIETSAAYLAANNISSADLQRMKDLLARIKMMVEQNDHENYRIAEQEFHKTMIYSTGNKYIVRMYNDLSIDLSRYQFTLTKMSQLQINNELSCAIHYRTHKRIFNALQAGLALEAQEAIASDLMIMYRTIFASVFQ